ncbi:unnamed protein product [Kuraishia capsulata CBS 1993]|uniref:Amidohydrolase-related domain-containing protein n=1 Tax=Kuraishia capsulata CBS 1993 TaxID=1382522 RepID=W6MKP3_9ASCO|nr:uncharacterized protein KUCA_T00002561001 [Kuraishia capsulata CBS 1993]CDK26588.1 unnamed protein product [Kuraishia capsulata CBS 1993]
MSCGHHGEAHVGGTPQGRFADKTKYTYAGKLVSESQPGPPFTVHTSTLFDPMRKKYRENVSVEIDPSSGLVIRCYQRTSEPQIGASDVDLRGKFVIPGLVDAHTHIFLHAYDERTSVEQKRDESVAERIIRSSNHCRTALLSGYTTYRDLGSEAMYDLDANVRDTINRGIMPGPRLYVATKVISSSSGYAARYENAMGGVQYPSLADYCDGETEIRKAVRNRIGAGADVIKFYADYRRRIMRYPPAQQHPYVGSVRFPPVTANPEVVAFTQKEMDTIVEEARMAGCAVAAHCGSNESASMAVKAGATSIEHAYWADEETLNKMAESNIIYVPTLYACELFFQDKMESILQKTRKAYDMGVTMACGGDTGTYPHGDNVHEMELMAAAGVPTSEVLRAGTYHGWLACGGDLIGKRFGWIEAGTCADMVALDRDPLEDIGNLRGPSFVMKDGEIYKVDGEPVMDKFF